MSIPMEPINIVGWTVTVLFAIGSLLACAGPGSLPSDSDSSMIDSNISVSGSYLGVAEKSIIGIEASPLDFSNVSLIPFQVEKITINRRIQFNYTFESDFSQFYWMFVEQADTADTGFTLITDLEFVQWVRSGLGLRASDAFTLMMAITELPLGPIKYGFYNARATRCIGFFGLFGSPRNVEGYKEARDATLSGEFCRQGAEDNDLLEYMVYTLGRLKIRNTLTN